MQTNSTVLKIKHYCVLRTQQRIFTKCLFLYVLYYTIQQQMYFCTQIELTNLRRITNYYNLNCTELCIQNISKYILYMYGTSTASVSYIFFIFLQYDRYSTNIHL